MTTLEGIVGAMLAGVVGVFFWMFKRSHTRIDKLDNRMRHAITESEVRQIIDDKLEPLRAQQMDFSHRLGRLEGKIDKLIELIMTKQDKT